MTPASGSRQRRKDIGRVISQDRISVRSTGKEQTLFLLAGKLRTIL